MLPDLPILTRNTYKSEFSGASYNPRTLIAKLPEPGIISLEKSNDFAQMFEYNATTIHERVHWFQHHGTSFGCFLESLRSSQVITTLRRLREMPSSKVKELLNQRTNFSKPILEIHQQEQYPIFDEENDNHEMNTFRQIWFDHQWLHIMLEDSSVLQSELRLRPIPESAFGEVIANVMLTLHGDFGFLPNNKNVMSIDYFESRKWFSVAEGEMIFTSWKSEHLTSRILMESAATISEIQLFRNTIHAWSRLIEESDLVKALENRVNRILKGDYGLPVRILLQELNVDFSLDFNLFFDILPTVNVLCFIALNPPLPPYVMSPPCDASSWRWQDIYPPIRFIQLAQYVKKIGLLNDWQNHKAISSYIDKVCDLYKIPHVINLNYPERLKRDGTCNFSEDRTEYPDPCGTIHHDYVFWVQSRMAHYRLTSLPLMVSLGDCMGGDLAVKHSQELLYERTGVVPFSYSPFCWNKNNTLGFLCPSNFGNALMPAIACSYAAFDLVVGTGKYDLSQFPGEVSADEEFYSLLERSILHMTTEVKNQ